MDEMESISSQHNAIGTRYILEEKWAAPPQLPPPKTTIVAATTKIRKKNIFFDANIVFPRIL